MRSSVARYSLLFSIVAALLLSLNFGVAQEKLPKLPRSALRLREGTRLTDVNGRFEVAGDRVSFAAAESVESLRVLENLALERITRVLAENRASPEWTISGTITEYNGANYLLLTKAVQTGKPAAKEATVKEPAVKETTGPAAGGIGTRPGVDYSGGKEKKPGIAP